MATREKRGLSHEAGEVLARLEQGPITLGDVLDLTTSSGDLRRWCDELREAGYLLGRSAGDGGSARWRLADGADVGPAQDDVGFTWRPDVGPASSLARTAPAAGPLFEGSRR